MSWDTIIISLLSCAFIGDLIMRMLFKSDRRVADAKADIAESEAAKAAVEVRKAIEAAHMDECKHYEERLTSQRSQYEERISDLHNTIDKMNSQLESYVERDIAKDKRFDSQTEKYRDTRSHYEDALIKIADYERTIGTLELELEKKRCDLLTCPFRQPPNTHTPPSTNETKEEYFSKRNKR